MNKETINYQVELSKAKVEAANRYLGIKSKQLDLYQKMSGYLLLKNPLKTLICKDELEVPVSKLWQYGISGDLPILLIRIKELTQIELLEEALKAYEYFRMKTNGNQVQNVQQLSPCQFQQFFLQFSQ